MQLKQHISFKNRLLVMLFLFFNCVCTAAPVLKLTGAEGTVSTWLVPIPIPPEGGEENHTTTYTCINHFLHFSFRKQCDKCLDHAPDGSSTTSFFAIDGSKVYLHKTSVLPIPGYYAFLFRYNLF